jgi:hypothetical protein
VLRDALDWPVEGLLAHVEHQELWWPAWGERPRASAEAVNVARRALGELAPLVPVRNYHYLSSEPSQPGNPVFLCHETDVFVCSSNLWTSWKGVPQEASRDGRGRCAASRSGPTTPHRARDTPPPGRRPIRTRRTVRPTS